MGTTRDRAHTGAARLSAETQDLEHQDQNLQSLPLKYKLVPRCLAFKRGAFALSEEDGGVDSNVREESPQRGSALAGATGGGRRPRTSVHLLETGSGAGEFPGAGVQQRFEDTFSHIQC